MNFHVEAGAINNQVLWLGTSHRAYQVFLGNVSEAPIIPRRQDQRFFHLIDETGIPAAVEEVLNWEGFGGVLKVGCIRIDHAYITALMEFWRPETHTFHFPCGEVTVTLQDIQVLWGLPIDGAVVTGDDDVLLRADLNTYMEELLGFIPPLSKSNIKLKDLLAELQTPIKSVLQRARVYILHMIGGTLCPNTTGNMVHVSWLKNLDKVGRERTSWGSAVLAQLYRNMCKIASNHTLQVVGGPMSLLQLWAWERILPSQPGLKEQGPDKAPSFVGEVLGVRWTVERSFLNVTNNCLAAYRQTLSMLQDPQFMWNPYDDKIHLLSESCRSGMASWRSDTYLICWEIVEPHLPSRVMRQFSLGQQIPIEVGFSRADHEKLHKESKAGNRTDKNYERKYNHYIELWKNRYQNVAPAVPLDNNTTAAYRDWYGERTTSYINRPMGPSTNTRFQNIAPNMAVLYEGMSHFQNYAGEVGSLATRYIEQSQTANFFQHQAPHVVEGQQPFVPTERRIRRQPRRRNARENRQHEDHNIPEPSQPTFIPVPAQPAFMSDPSQTVNTLDLNTVEVGQSSNPIDQSSYPVGQSSYPHADQLALSLAFDTSSQQQYRPPSSEDYYTPAPLGQSSPLNSSGFDFIQTPMGRSRPFDHSPLGGFSFGDLSTINWDATDHENDDQ